MGEKASHHMAPLTSNYRTADRNALRGTVREHFTAPQRMRPKKALFFRESYLGAIMLQSVGVAIASLIEGWLGSLLGPRSSQSVLGGMSEAGLSTLALFALLG